MSEFEDEAVPESDAYGKVDEKRLGQIKELIFNLAREKTGQALVEINELVKSLNEIRIENEGKTFGSALF